MNAKRTFDAPGVPAFSTAKERNHKLRQAPGRLLQVDASNLSAGDLFLQVHNTLTTLAGGEVPLFTVPIPALGFGTITNKQCTVGITVALSTAADSYTDPGAVGWFYGETM